MDARASVDIVFKHAFNKIRLPETILKPSQTPVYGFNDKEAIPYEKHNLLVKVGT